VAVVVSEETGRISYVENGKIENNISPDRLKFLLDANE
jgi:DNA integrity scanning protein DisA with diadenylate cyclase activity